VREEAAIDTMLGRRRRFEPITILGLLLTIGLHGGAVTGIILYRRATQAAPKQYDDQSYVVAKLVRLGKPRDEKKMPDKVVPQEATRKEEGVDLSADASDAPSKKKKKDEDRSAKVSDKLRHSLDKAELLAQAQKEVDQEGSPDGVVGGTARSGREGDPWMTKIADLFTRTWSPPAVIPRDERERLYVLLRLRIDASGTLQLPIKFDRRSGNALFDNSIDAAWQSIKQIPLPPADRMALILGNGLKLKINWKGLQ
jgi:hypothetical protein